MRLFTHLAERLRRDTICVLLRKSQRCLEKSHAPDAMCCSKQAATVLGSACPLFLRSDPSRGVAQRHRRFVPDLRYYERVRNFLVRDVLRDSSHMDAQFPSSVPKEDAGEAEPPDPSPTRQRPVQGSRLSPRPTRPPALRENNNPPLPNLNTAGVVHFVASNIHAKCANALLA